MSTTPIDSYLKGLDYSVVQQCMHCGMCLPTCPTYDITKLERHSPRGRIALMRAIADDRMQPTAAFADEMSYCLGCLACKTACPADVDYPLLFEMARAEVERSGVRTGLLRKVIRFSILRVLFSRQWLLHLLGRSLYYYRVSGLQGLIRKSRVLRLLPDRLQYMERMSPDMQAQFSHQLIAVNETPSASPQKYKVGLLTGCVQDMMYADVNRDTATVLLDAGCAVFTPRAQLCCGSLHAHNGEYQLSKDYARKLIDQFDLNQLDAIISNAGGCGSHLRHYDRLLADDPAYAEKASQWSAKFKDVHEWLVSIDYQPSGDGTVTQRLTYHDSCHLAHGQGIVQQPRQLLSAVPGLVLIELPEANTCCGSAGVYNLTQPDTAAELALRKLANIRKTGCTTVATANPGCLLQLQKFAEQAGHTLEVVHPVSVLARAIRQRGKPPANQRIELGLNREK